MMPQDVFDRMMDGEITPRQATKEAAEIEAENRAFNDELRAQLAVSAKDRERGQQEWLQARLFGPREQPRDDAGRFAPNDPSPATSVGFDGGARGDAVPVRGERQRVNDAIETLVEHRGNELADHGEPA